MDSESHYSTFDKELLAVDASVKKFQHSIEGRKVIVYNAHKPLTSSMNKSNSSSTLPLRAKCHLLFISQFTTDIRHVAGEANKVADALSRPPLPSEDKYTKEYVLQEPFTLSPPAPSPSPPPPPSPTSTSRAAATAGHTGDVEEAAGSPAMGPSVSGVVDVRRVFDLATNLPADEARINLAAMQAAQVTDTEAD